jgi:hypothetical protein
MKSLFILPGAIALSLLVLTSVLKAEALIPLQPLDKRDEKAIEPMPEDLN